MTASAVAVFRTGRQADGMVRRIDFSAQFLSENSGNLQIDAHGKGEKEKDTCLQLVVMIDYSLADNEFDSFSKSS